MKKRKRMSVVVFFFIAILAILIASPLVVQTSAAYNPITAEKEGLSNLEKARIILEHFQKSGVDSSWTYDIQTNKDVVESMLEACVAMTDEEVSQLSYDEKISFYEYFQKLYEVSGLDATELGELFEIKDLEKTVDEIYNVADKKAEEALDTDVKKDIVSPEDRKSITIVIITILALGVIGVTLSQTIKRVNNK